MEAAIEAIQAEGTGTTGSRIANGSYSEHVALEKEIAEFYGKKHCMVFTTGYQANLGVISTLVGPDDFLLIDADSHASIYDACKQTQAEVVRFKHNDPASLERRLRRLGDKPGNRLVVLEGIYSMLGDSAPLKEFIDGLQEVRRLRAGRRGPFAGRAGRERPRPVRGAGVLDDCHFIVGTFSKTLGAIGGYCVSTIPDFDILRVTTRAYMFTASLPPSIVASVRQALRWSRRGPSCASSCGTTSPRSTTAWRAGLQARARAWPGGRRPSARPHDGDRLLAAPCSMPASTSTSPCRRPRPTACRCCAARSVPCTPGAARAHDRGHDRHRPPDGRARAQAAGGRLTHRTRCHPSWRSG
jgi:hypothetical protein